MPVVEMLVDSGGPGVKIQEQGSRFNFQLNPPFTLPLGTKRATLSIPASTIWWTIPNVSMGKNNVFYIRGPDVNNTVKDYQVVIKQGLYSLSQLETTILASLEDQKSQILPQPLFNFFPDSATGKVVIRLNYTTVVVTFFDNSPFNLLGFDNLPPNNIITGAIINNLAPNVANFNPVDSFLIHSSLVREGLPVNDIRSSVVSQVHIDVPPGSQIVTNSFRPPIIDASNLIGEKTTQIEMWLTDSKNNPVDTNGEHWSARIAIEYN